MSYSWVRPCDESMDFVLGAVTLQVIFALLKITGFEEAIAGVCGTHASARVAVKLAETYFLHNTSLGSAGDC